MPSTRDNPTGNGYEKKVHSDSYSALADSAVPSIHCERYVRFANCQLCAQPLPRLKTEKKQFRIRVELGQTTWGCKVEEKRRRTSDRFHRTLSAAKSEFRSSVVDNSKMHFKGLRNRVYLEF